MILSRPVFFEQVRHSRNISIVHIMQGRKSALLSAHVKLSLTAFLNGPPIVGNKIFVLRTFVFGVLII